MQRLNYMNVDNNLDVKNEVVHRFPQTRVQKRGTETGILMWEVEFYSWRNINNYSILFRQI
jgi:hypothetical protein